MFHKFTLFLESPTLLDPPLPIRSASDWLNTPEPGDEIILWGAWTSPRLEMTDIKTDGARLSHRNDRFVYWNRGVAVLWAGKAEALAAVSVCESTPV